jgi:hypothetical protein
MRKRREMQDIVAFEQGMCLEVGCVQCHKANQACHKTSGRESDNPSHEDESKLPPIDGT